MHFLGDNLSFKFSTTIFWLVRKLYAISHMCNIAGNVFRSEAPDCTCGSSYTIGEIVFGFNALSPKCSTL